jgi:hypothetical protein
MGMYTLHIRVWIFLSPPVHYGVYRRGVGRTCTVLKT